MSKKQFFHGMKIGVYALTIFTMTFMYTVVDISPATAETATVTGRILAGGSPVGADAVSVSIGDPFATPVGYTMTVSDGSFTIFDVPTGTGYAIEMRIEDGSLANNYVATTIQNVDVTSATVDLGDISLTAATKTVTGKVTRKSTGAAVSGAVVDAFKMDGTPLNKSATTSATGEFTLKLTGGRWGTNVSGGYDNEGNPREVDWIYAGSPKDLNFASDNSVELMTVNYQVTTANSYVTGKVLYPSGNVAAQLNIDLFSQGGANIHGMTDSNGNFSLRTTAGTFELNSWFSPDQQMYQFPRTQVTVNANETKNVGTIQITKKNSKITGTVTTKNGTPLPNMRVNAFGMGGPSGPGGDFAETQTDSSGNYTLWVGTGRYGVEVQQDFNSDYVSAGFPKEYDVGPNETLSNVNFKLVRADVTINGTVVDTSGKKVSSFYGYAEARDASSSFAPGPGKFFGSPIMDGNFTIKLPSASIDSVIVTSYIEPGLNFSIQKDIEVDIAANGSYDVQLVLVPNDAVVRGTVIDNYGDPVSNFEYGDVFVMGQQGQWNGAPINPDGTYNISLRSGTYQGMGAFVDGGAYINQPPKFEENGIAIPAGTTTKNIVVYKADAQLKVTIKKPDGTLYNGFAFVFAQEEFEEAGGNFKDAIESGSEAFGGKATLNVVGGKTYFIGAGLPPELQEQNWMPPSEEFVTVAANGSKSVTLQFKEADGRMTGNVTFEDGTPVPFGFLDAWADGPNSGAEIFNGQYSLPLTRDMIWNATANTFTGTDFYRGEDYSFRTPDEKGFVLNKDFVVKKSDFRFPASKCETWDAGQPKTMGLSDGTEIQVPSGAFATSGNVKLCAQPNVQLKSEKTNKLAKGFGYSFTVTDSSNQTVSQFNSAVTISFPVEAEKLAESGLTPQDLLPAFYNTTSGKWERVTTGVYDSENDVMTFTTTHFTDFALVTGAATISSSVVNSDIIASPYANGGPQITVWDGAGNAKLNFFAFPSHLRFGIQAQAGDLDGDGTNEIVAVPEAGGGPQVRVFDLEGNLIDQFWAYASHIRSGVNLQVADVDGDGADEVITVAMAGAGPQVRIFNASGEVESQFWAYMDSFRGGVSISTGDVDGDGIVEMITVPMSNGGPQVRVFDYDGSVVTQFMAFPEFIRGGYQTVAADVDGDGDVDISVVPKTGNGPQVAMFDGDGNKLGQFMAFASTFRGGVNLSVNDVNADGTNEIVATAYSNGGPQVRVFNAAGDVLSSFMAYADYLRGGFTTTLADVNNDGTREIVTAPGDGFGPHIGVFNFAGDALSNFFSHHPGFRGGVSVMSMPSF